VKAHIFLTVALLLTSAAAHAELRLEVDLSRHQLVAVADGEEVGSFNISGGKEKYPTPTGTFKIRKLIWNPSWKPPDAKWAKGKKPTPPGHKDNPMKVVKIFFKEPDYYIHGTGDVESLGGPASHGCIRMAPDDVAKLGQLVMEHGGKTMPESWWRRIFRRRTTKVVYLEVPVPIQIRS
jgi:lipoprotein-anchoring transpeptidase ErfK/SrfK